MRSIFLFSWLLTSTMVLNSYLIVSCCWSLLLICCYVPLVGKWTTNPQPIPLLGLLQGDKLYWIYIVMSYNSAEWTICLRGIQTACTFTASFYFSCWINQVPAPISRITLYQHATWLGYKFYYRPQFILLWNWGCGFGFRGGMMRWRREGHGTKDMICFGGWQDDQSRWDSS